MNAVQASSPNSVFRERRLSPRQQRWLKRLRLAAIAFGFCAAIIYPFLAIFPPRDLQIFLAAARGESYDGFFYAPWILPLFSLLDLLPLPIAAALANLISCLGYFFALRLFKGGLALFFISYPLFIQFYYGQMDGLYAFGLALMLIGLRRDHAPLAAAGWLLAIVKFYVGIPLGIGLLLYEAQSMKTRWRVVLIVLALGLASFVVWPNWLPILLENSRDVPPNTAYSIDAWGYTGPAILLLWLPLLLSRRRDFRWWVAAWSLTVPYLYVWGLTYLLLFPLGWVGWLVQVSYVTGFVVSTFLLAIPAYVYVQCWRESWRSDRLATLLARRRA